MPRPPGTARLATWNVRWFPDGGPGGGRPGGGAKPTDVAWLACAMAFLDADVITLEELKSTPAASNALALLLSSLDAIAGGSHRVEVDRCPGAGRQSVALLYDEHRVTARGFRNVAALNPRGGACDEHLRPGLGGYFRFPGGADLHFVAVHLKSGAGAREYDLRRTSIAGLLPAYRDLQTTDADGDVVVAGDFNTMGCPDCRPRVRASEEVREIDGAVAGLEVPFRRIEADLQCSEYYRGEGTLLDHFVVTRGMREASLALRAHVEGYCREVACARLDPKDMPRAYRELSDHCPVVLDLEDRDVD